MYVWESHKDNENPGQVWHLSLICHPDLNNEIGPGASQGRGSFTGR